MKTFKIYFWFIIVFIGTAGIWLPLIASSLSSGSNTTLDLESIPINITSYFIVLLITSCTDKGLEMVQGIMPKKELLLMIIILILSLMYVFFIGILVAKKNDFSWILSIIGLLFSLYYWYKNSKDNPKYSDASDALGGSSSQFN